MGLGSPRSSCESPFFSREADIGSRVFAVAKSVGEQLIGQRLAATVFRAAVEVVSSVTQSDGTSCVIGSEFVARPRLVAVHWLTSPR